MPILVLQADDVGVGEVEEIGRAQVRVELLLLDLEPDLGRVFVTLGESLTGTTKQSGPGILGGDRRAQVVGEGRDAALPRQVIADERDLLDLAVPFHRVSEARSMQGKAGLAGRGGAAGVRCDPARGEGSEPIRPLS